MSDNEHKQASTEEIAQRVDWIVERMVSGYSQAAIVQAAKNTVWGASLSKRQLRNYCYKAESVLAGEAEQIDRRSHLAVALQRYTYLYRQLVQKSDYRGAIMPQDRIVDLLGLSAATALSINWRDTAANLGIDPDALFEKVLSELDESEGVRIAG